VGRSAQAVRDLDERLTEKFLAARQRQGRIHRGNRETVGQFLDHLRERNVIRGVKPPLDESRLAGILTRYAGTYDPSAVLLLPPSSTTCRLFVSFSSVISERSPSL
jgi:hypothetical protein